jgi:deoxyribonuclease-4
VSLKFGVSGNSDSFYQEGNKRTVEAFAWLKDRELDAFEYPFGRGVSMSDETAKEIGKEAKKHSIIVTAHAPYYINFADPQRLEQNIAYCLQSAKALNLMGGKRLVVHVGGQKKLNREVALKNCKAGLYQMLNILEKEKLPVTCFIETLGKPGQIGNLDEILMFCRSDERLYPCIDFAHIHALNQGSLNSEDDFLQVLLQVEDSIGMDKAKQMHIHFSAIEYGAKGEIRHRVFGEGFGPDFSLLAPLLYQRGYEGVLICESRGTQAEDAQTMKKRYILSKI